MELSYRPASVVCAVHTDVSEGAAPVCVSPDVFYSSLFETKRTYV